ncbi:MAG: hypothetical protein U9P50_02265 [Patescibacteria group bacterium]|nr:hypothetical protein [Patescibacteria group bacterium]
MSPEVTTLITKINSEIIAPIILLLFSLSLVMFFWGLADFIRGANNEVARKTGKDHMIWGVVGMFIMVSAWGIVLITINTFSIETPDFPAGIFQ